MLLTFGRVNLRQKHEEARQHESDGHGFHWGDWEAILIGMPIKDELPYHLRQHIENSSVESNDWPGFQSARKDPLLPGRLHKRDTGVVNNAPHVCDSC